MMAPKTITVVDDRNNQRKKRLASEDGYKNLLSEFGVAFLKDDDGVEIEDFASLLDGKIYTLGPQQQQQQQFSEMMACLASMDKKLDDMATLSIGMSEATQDFTRELLGEKGIKYKTLSECTVIKDPTFAKRIYQWRQDEDEKDGQPGCKKWLEDELLPLSVDNKALGIFDVRSKPLPEVHEGKRKSKGYADLAVGDLLTLSKPENSDLMFNLSLALIELKTGQAALKQGQLLLQLFSLSLLATAQKGVVVLGTDCARKWRLVYFSKFNEITLQPYSCGKKCLDDFVSLLKSSTLRGEDLLAPIPMQTMKETIAQSDDIQEPIDPSAHIQTLKNQLASLFPSEQEFLLPVMDEEQTKPPSTIYI